MASGTTVLEASIAHPRGSAIYNVADDQARTDLLDSLVLDSGFGKYLVRQAPDTAHAFEHRDLDADDAGVGRRIVRRAALSRHAGARLVLIADVARARPADGRL